VAEPPTQGLSQASASCAVCQVGRVRKLFVGCMPAPLSPRAMQVTCPEEAQQLEGAATCGLALARGNMGAEGCGHPSILL